MIGGALKVADLFAEVGFKVSQRDFESIKSSFNSIKLQLDELIKSTANFATALTNLSLRTRLSPKLIQDIELLGQKAGVAKDDIHSMLDTMSGVAQRAYWGYGNEFAQWGLFFDRNETSASALLKTLQKLNVSTPQRQREIANAIGLQLETALRFAEQVKTSGFNVNNPFSLGDKNIKEMDKVNIELGLIEDSWDRLKNKIVGSQSGAILSYTQRVSNWISWLQKNILNISQAKFFSGTFDKLIRAIPFIDVVLNHAGKVFQTISMASKIIGTAFKTINWILIIGFFSKILSFFGLPTNNLFKTLQKQFDNFVETGGKFGKEIKKQIDSALMFLENTLADILPDFITNRESYRSFFSTAKSDGIFIAISKLMDKIWDALILIYKAILNFIKNLVSLLAQAIKLAVTEIFLTGTRYLRVAFLYVLNDLKKNLSGTWLGRQLGDPETEESLKIKADDILNEVDIERDKKRGESLYNLGNSTIKPLKDLYSLLFGKNGEASKEEQKIAKNALWGSDDSNTYTQNVLDTLNESIRTSGALLKNIEANALPNNSTTKVENIYNDNKTQNVTFNNPQDAVNDWERMNAKILKNAEEWQKIYNVNPHNTKISSTFGNGNGGTTF